MRNEEIAEILDEELGKFLDSVDYTFLKDDEFPLSPIQVFKIRQRVYEKVIADPKRAIRFLFQIKERLDAIFSAFSRIR